MIFICCASEFAKKDVQPRMYLYEDLQKATNYFHPNMKLGQGAFGAVYKVLTKHLILLDHFLNPSHQFVDSIISCIDEVSTQN
jgi:hypothetical protein